MGRFLNSKMSYGDYCETASEPFFRSVRIDPRTDSHNRKKGSVFLHYKAAAIWEKCYGE